MPLVERVLGLVRFELSRNARSARFRLGLAGAVAVIAADHLLRDPAARVGDSLFVIAFLVALLALFRTGWADDLASAFDELLVPALMQPREYFLSRLLTGAALILIAGAVTGGAELALGEPRAAAWYFTYCVMAAWMFTPVALWAEHHSRLRWPMVFPCFLFVTATIVAELLVGAAAAPRRFLGLEVSAHDYGTLLPGIWRALVVVPALHLLLYLHAFPRRLRAVPAGIADPLIAPVDAREEVQRRPV